MFHQEAPAVEPAVPVHVAYTPTFWGAHGQDRIWGVRADMESAVERFEWVDAIEGGSPELVVVWRRSGTRDHVDDCEETTGTMSELIVCGEDRTPLSRAGIAIEDSSAPAADASLCPRGLPAESGYALDARGLRRRPL